MQTWDVDRGEGSEIKARFGGVQDKRPEQRDWNPHQLRKQMARKDLPLRA